MIRHLCAISVLFCAIDAHADDHSPEQLLPATTQAYARWDGVAAHRDAYRESARGKMFAGETGHAFEVLLERASRKLKLDFVGEPLLNGESPDELLKVRAHVKALSRLPHLLAESGIVMGFEIRPPTLIELFKSRTADAATKQRLLDPHFLLTVVVPGAAEKPEIAAALQLFVRNSKASMKEQTVFDRKVRWLSEDNNQTIVAAWAEGKHFVLTFGNLAIGNTVAKIKDAGPGITNHPLYKQLANFKDFRVVTRGFVDVGNVISLFDRLLKGYAPEVGAIIDDLGLPGVKSICFWDGFEGEESRGAIEIDMPGPRKGLANLFKPLALKPADLPPFPNDLVRFTAVRLDLAAIYDLFPLIDGITGFSGVDENDAEFKDVGAKEWLNKRKQQFFSEIDAVAGIKMADLFGSLGNTFVTYHAPSDGILNMGQVIAVSVKDEKLLRQCLESLRRRIEGQARDSIVVKKRDCLGVEVNEFIVKGNSPVTVAYAICDGWLVFGFQPQPVRGFIHRCKGKLPTWKPDARTAAAIAKIPADRCVIQVADPRPTLQWLFNAAPIVAGFIGGRENAEPFIDPGLFPHSGEATKHLFPNVSWCRDDGKVMRWESRDSLWLPMEFVGLEWLAVYAGILGKVGF